MNIRNTLTLIAFSAVVFTGGCDTTKTSTEPDDAELKLRKANQLCALESGKYCTTDSSGGTTTQPLEGWACCAPKGTPCVAVSTYGECTQIGGWCNNYTVNADETITCHD